VIKEPSGNKDTEKKLTDIYSPAVSYFFFFSCVLVNQASSSFLL